MIHRFWAALFLFILATSTLAKDRSDELYLVVHVVDGDTIQIERGEWVRYIGIDTPELRKKTERGWKYQPQPYGEEAKRLNKNLVEGKRVRLEFDVEKRDRYGRLLAYVFVEDVFVNREMLHQGAARLLTIPPNVRYVGTFKEALQEARKSKRGMWVKNLQRAGAGVNL